MKFGIIIYLFCNLLDYYIRYRITNIFFDKKNINRVKELSLFFSLYIISSALNIIFRNPFINILVSVVGFLLVTRIYNAKRAKRVIIVLLTYVIFMPVDLLVAVFISSSISSEYIYLIGSPIVSIFCFIIELIIERIIVINKDIEPPVKQGLFILVIPILGICAIINIAFSKGIHEIVLTVQCGVFILINIVTFTLYDWIMEVFSIKYEKDLLKQNLQSYENQLDIMKQSQERVNSLKHDIKHHILAINHMARESNSEEIIKYVSMMEKEIDNPAEVVSSGNKSIDSILNHMISKAKKITDNIEIDVRVPNDICLEMFNINIILGNLMENSIRALEDNTEGILKVLVKYDRGIIYIDIENSYSGEVKIKRGKYVTTKNDLESHGIGLENVKRIVERYNGEINIYHEENVFKVNILMYV